MAYGQVSADVINTSVSGSSLGAGNASIMKNRIINGAMVINQRGFSGTITANSTYTLDRYLTVNSQNSKFSISQNAGSVTPPVGFTNYLGVTSLSAYTVGSGESFSIATRIEGYNTADLGWGSANAKTVTLSFWVRSSLTGTFGGVIANGNWDRGYPFTYTISSANTWTQASITIAGDTTGTWATDNSTGIQVIFGLGNGATVSGTAGAWASGFYSSATGATSVVGTNGATWYITGLQLEVGSSATGFEYRQYGQELALCQRYFCYLFDQDNTQGSYNIGSVYTGSRTFMKVFHPVPMRTQPTVTNNSLTVRVYYNNTSQTTATLANAYPYTQSTGLEWTTSGATVGSCFINLGSGTGTVTASAEL